VLEHPRFRVQPREPPEAVHERWDREQDRCLALKAAPQPPGVRSVLGAAARAALKVRERAAG
jgi:hypothetical protein